MTSEISESRERAIEQAMNMGGGSYEEGGFFTTFSGMQINPFHPNINVIKIEDIAQALSNCCRFGGHVNRFYSVAQHSVLVSQMCDPEDALAGLLHDGSEAYLSDIVRPVKYTKAFESYRNVEAVLEQAIALRFKQPWPMPPSVKQADDMLVCAEAFALFSPVPKWAIETLKNKWNRDTPHIEIPACWTPFFAKSMFLRTYMELSAGIILTTQKEN